MRPRDSSYGRPLPSISDDEAVENQGPGACPPENSRVPAATAFTDFPSARVASRRPENAEGKPAHQVKNNVKSNPNGTHRLMPMRQKHLASTSQSFVYRSYSAACNYLGGSAALYLAEQVLQGIQEVWSRRNKVAVSLACVVSEGVGDEVACVGGTDDVGLLRVDFPGTRRVRTERGDSWHVASFRG